MRLQVKISNKNKNIKVVDSYKITNKKDMLHFLKTLPLELVNRSAKSCLNEWIAHNRLYKLGLFKEHTMDCDLSANESLFRRICYWLLSRF